MQLPRGPDAAIVRARVLAPGACSGAVTKSSTQPAAASGARQEHRLLLPC